MAESDHAACERGQLSLKGGKRVFERGHHIGEQQQHNGQGYHEHCYGVGHGSTDAALQFFSFFAVLCQTL